MTDPATYINGRTVQEQMNSLIGYVDQRSAEVAVDAIASDVAQVAADKADAHADALAAAASAAAAAGTLANAVKKTGESSQSIAGDIAVAGDLDVGGDADVTGALDVTGAITGNDASLIGTVTVPTEATGTFTMKSANSTKVKNELDNYAAMVRTSGNQIPILGFKIFELANGKLATHQRVTGTSLYELFRYALPGAATNTSFMVVGMSRGTGLIGLLTIAYDGVSAITMTFNGTTLYGTPGQTGYFAFIDTVNQEIVVCAGNVASGNNYMATQIIGAYSGAGIEQALDFTKMATARTAEYTAAASTTSYRWCD